MPEISGELKRAKIVVVDKDKEKVSKDAHEIPFLFNPPAFEVSYSAEFNIEPEYTPVEGEKDKKERKLKSAKIDYKGPGVKQLSLEMLFDTTEERKVEGKTYKAGESVKKLFIDKLLTIMNTMIKEKAAVGEGTQHRPPKCKFEWGELALDEDNLKEEYFLDSLKVTYLFFDSNGRPLRAKAAITMKRDVPPVPGQNPTTVSVPRKIWVVEAGQTLDWIAYQEYGASARWRLIAEANDLANPQKLRPGQVLKIPPAG